jgi:hypothetical protein
VDGTISGNSAPGLAKIQVLRKFLDANGHPHNDKLRLSQIRATKAAVVNAFARHVRDRGDDSTMGALAFKLGDRPRRVGSSAVRLASGFRRHETRVGLESHDKIKSQFRGET